MTVIVTLPVTVEWTYVIELAIWLTVRRLMTAAGPVPGVNNRIEFLCERLRDGSQNGVQRNSIYFLYSRIILCAAADRTLFSWISFITSISVWMANNSYIFIFHYETYNQPKTEKQKFNIILFSFSLQNSNLLQLTRIRMHHQNHLCRVRCAGIRHPDTITAWHPARAARASFGGAYRSKLNIVVCVMENV